MGKISRSGGPTVAGVPGLDNQSDREEDQLPEQVGGRPDVATRIEQASQQEEGGRGGAGPVGDTDDTPQGEEYDPADYTVSEVNAYLDQCAAESNRDEYDRVMDAERRGRGRLSILNRR
jgi:hypothetical protein